MKEKRKDRWIDALWREKEQEGRREKGWRGCVRGKERREDANVKPVHIKGSGQGIVRM